MRPYGLPPLQIGVQIDLRRTRLHDIDPSVFLILRSTPRQQTPNGGQEAPSHTYQERIRPHESHSASSQAS
jgi:hypothetical protein